jgi:hypothetical protein
MSTRARVLYPGGVVLLVVLCCATIGPSARAAARAAATDGIWTGTWTRTEPVAGAGQLTLTLKEGEKASLRLTGSACLSSDTPATATLTDSNVRIEVKGNGVTALFTGTVSGSKMSGTMTVSCGRVTGKGNWQATKS